MWVWVAIGLFIVGFPVILSLILDPIGIVVAVAALIVLALVLLANAFLHQRWSRGRPPTPSRRGKDPKASPPVRG